MIVSVRLSVTWYNLNKYTHADAVFTKRMLQKFTRSEKQFHAVSLRPNVAQFKAKQAQKGQFFAQKFLVYKCQSQAWL